MDSPVTGAVDGARNGTLTLFVGGDTASYARIEPVLDGAVLERSRAHCEVGGTHPLRRAYRLICARRHSLAAAESKTLNRAVVTAASTSPVLHRPR